MSKLPFTPMEDKLPLTKDEKAFDVDVHLYRSMIGSLMYLTASRPDIMYAGITPSILEAILSDSDYGGSNLDRKSTTGGCQFLGQRLISWKCKKQTIVATSTTEAEYVAAANCLWKVYYLEFGKVVMKDQLETGRGHASCQPQPSAAPTPSQPVPTPSSSHVQITQPQSPPPPITSTPPPITQSPPTLTQHVQSSSPPPQPSSVQLNFFNTLTYHQLKPNQHHHLSTSNSSPSYHDTEGPSFEPSYHMSPPPSHEPEIQTSRPSEESEQLRNLMDIVPRLESRVESLEKELSETKQTLGTAILLADRGGQKARNKFKEEEEKCRKLRKSPRRKEKDSMTEERTFKTKIGRARGRSCKKKALATEFELHSSMTKCRCEIYLPEKIHKRKGASNKQDTITISQLRNQMITYLKHVANKKHAELKSKSFEEIQVLTEGLNLVHEEVKEKKEQEKEVRHRRKLKAERKKSMPLIFKRKMMDLRYAYIKLLMKTIKVIDVVILDHNIPIVEWKDSSAPWMGDPPNFGTEKDLKGDTADFWDEQLDWKIISWKLHSSSGVHTIMTSNGLVIHMLVENRYPLIKEVLSQLLDLKLETEEESTMALELIKFVKQQLEELGDSDNDDLAKSDHEREERV
ncbi:hypothetical protein Tco_0003483 [Tanacetum coccineum]